MKVTLLHEYADDDYFGGKYSGFQLGDDYLTIENQQDCCEEFGAHIYMNDKLIYQTRDFLNPIPDIELSNITRVRFDNRSTILYKSIKKGCIPKCDKKKKFTTLDFYNDHTKITFMIYNENNGYYPHMYKVSYNGKLDGGKL
jgi:hypothetical protein